MAFSLSTVGSTSYGNGTEVRGDKKKKERKAKHSVVLETEGKQVSQSTRHKGHGGQAVSPNKTPHPAAEGSVTDSDRSHRKAKEVSWISLASRPHSSVRSHILHNPAKSCHFKSP